MNTIHLAAGCPCLLNSDGGLLVACETHQLLIARAAHQLLVACETHRLAALREHARHGHYLEAPCAICDMAAEPHQSRHDAFAVWFCDDSDEPMTCGGCGNLCDPWEPCPTCATIARTDDS